MKANSPDKFAPIRSTNKPYEPEHFIGVSRWNSVIKLHIKPATLSEDEWSVLKAIAFNMEWNITETTMKLNNAKTLQMFGNWSDAAKPDPHRKVIIKSEEPSNPPQLGNPPITKN